MSALQGTTARLLAVHPVLGASDVQASIKFFVDLGFAIGFLDDPVSPKYACLVRDDVEIHVQWNEVPGTIGLQDRPVYRFLVQDVDALFKEFSARNKSVLAAASETPWHAPANTPWGTREFHVRDPNGNGLQFYQLHHPNRGDA